MDDAQMQVAAVLAALPSADLERSVTFYETLLGRPVDGRPMPVLAEWEWGTSGLQLVADADRAGGGLVTIMVLDLAAAVQGAQEQGVPVEAADGTVVAAFAVLTDPDGNQVTLVQAG